MRNKITIVTAFLVVMIAMTGMAAAYDATLTKHDGTPADHPILVWPGETFHLHFEMSGLNNAATLNHLVDYMKPEVVLFQVEPPGTSTSQVGLTVTVPKFTPLTDPWIDMDLSPPCCNGSKVPVPSGTHPDRININVFDNATFDANYTINIPTTSEFTGEDGTASRTLQVISPNTTMTKTADPQTLVLTPGGSGTVTYTITEKNTGDVPLMTTVSDPGIQGFSGTSCTPSLPDGPTLYNPGDSKTFTCKVTYTDSQQGVHVNTATATSNPVVTNPETGQNMTLNLTVNESASATVNVITQGCTTGECKFKTWGLLGNVANPEKKFEMLFFSPIPNGGPQGSMTVEDNKLGMTIESTQVTSIVTDKNAGTGTAMGRAHVTGGPHPGDYDFTVNVVDAAHSGTPRGTFELILTGFPGGYDNKGPLTFGAISIIK